MNRKSARPNRLRLGLGSLGAIVAATLLLDAGPSAALPTAPAPSAGPAHTPAPTSPPSGSAVLPLDSSLFFILDDPISSKMARDGDQVRAHLRDALIVGGRVVAPAGSPIIIKISNVYGAKAGDIDGSVDIFFGALTLAGGATLPLRTPTHHLTVNVSAGEASTAGITDTLKDIFIPGHQIFRLFRKGANVELAAGAIVRARTAAIIDASKAGAIAVVTPPPFNLGADVPHADYKPLPFETAPPKRGAPTPTPLPTPTPTPLPTPT